MLFALLFSASLMAGTLTVDSVVPGAGPVSHSTSASYTRLFGAFDANAYKSRGQSFTTAETGDANSAWSVTELSIQSDAGQSFGPGDTLQLWVFEWKPVQDATTVSQWITGDGLSDGDPMDGTTMGNVLISGDLYNLPASVTNGHYYHFGFDTPLLLAEDTCYGVFFAFNDADGATGATSVRIGIGASGSTYADGTQLRTEPLQNTSHDQDLTLFVTGTSAPGPTLKLASPFQDGMALQRDKPIKVWGQAEAYASVTVALNGTNVVGAADANGNWIIALPAMSQGGPYQMVTSSDGETNTLTDVLVGDVWIAFGQSNMVRPLSEMIGKQPYIDDISTNRMIRCLKVALDAALTAQESGSMTWLDNSNPGSWGSVAAVFAHQMHAGSGVPTAVIWAGWGSSSIEGWMPIQMTNDFPHYDAMMDHYQSIGEYTSGDITSSMLPAGYATNLEGITAMINGTETWDDVFIRTRPSIIYNQRIHPLLNFGISGFVWYQGEANAGNPVNVAQYGFTLPAFVTEYRELFGQGNLPFLGVQLPSYNSAYWAWFRESQSRVTALSNAYVAVTIDTGLVGDIHPYDKEPIGQRLALLGRKYALGEDIVAHGPTFDSMSIDGTNVTIAFAHADGLATDDAQAPAEFELAGADEVWHAATRSLISVTNVVVSSSSEPSPVAVRYAWSPAPVNEVNLVNSDGLPAVPFRTDDWAMPDLGAQAPQAVNDSYDVFTNDTLVVSVPGVLDNDIDLNRAPLSASLVSDVTHGTLAFVTNGAFNYTADAGFAGHDSFTYAVSDGTLSETATVSIAVHVGALTDGYSDTFDNDGLATNFGKGGGLINRTWFGSAWVDDGNLTGPVSGARWFRSLVYTALSYPVSSGFRLDVTYSVTNTVVGEERATATFGLVADDATEDDMDILFSREMPIYGIGMSLTDCTVEDGVQGLHTDTGTLTLLSNAQTVTAGTNRTFSLTALSDGSWSYSIDGAAPTTGANLDLDLGNDYRFAAFVRQDPGFVIQRVSLLPVASVTDIGAISAEQLAGSMQLAFRWNGEVGVPYVLETTEDLVNGPWTSVTSIWGAGEPIAVTGDMDRAKAFYRVSVVE